MIDLSRDSSGLAFIIFVAITLGGIVVCVIVLDKLKR